MAIKKLAAVTMMWVIMACVFLLGSTLGDTVSISTDQFFSSDPKDICVYTVYIKTGSMSNAGTDANIGARFYDSKGGSIIVKNLIQWGGLTPSRGAFYQQGSLDIFTGRGNCLSNGVCKLTLISDGTGSSPSWYASNVEVTSTGPHIPCHEHRFLVEQWVDENSPPYSLTVTRDDCSYRDIN